MQIVPNFISRTRFILMQTHFCIRLLIFTFLGKAFSKGIADVRITSASGSAVTGDLTIEEIGEKILIQGKVAGLLPGRHGFHIHQNQDIGNECKNAGGHFNPFHNNHGGPSSGNRHVGDLGNIVADSHGSVQISITVSLASLDPLSQAYVGNLSIVIHAGFDDFGLGGTSGSLTTGSAGARIGCGKIIMRGSESHKNLQNIDLASRPLTSEQLQNIRADVVIVPGSHNIGGHLQVQSRNGGIHIFGDIHGLSPGFHGFHVHQKGELTNACVDAGGHFNPYERNHGSPGRSQRHVGDLGNIFADAAGFAHINMYDDHASLNPLSPAYVGDRALVIHAGMDDLGLAPNADSIKTGNAGARSGCGKISVVVDAETNRFGFKRQVPDPSVTTFGKKALVDFIPGGGTSVSGSVTLEETDQGVFIKGQIQGLTPGLHGFHIHETPSLDNNCIAAGGHFNPFVRNHGSPFTSNRHVGDLGNVFADQNGIASIQIHDSKIHMDPNSISYIGDRSIVIHALPDDLGRGRNEGSLKTGNAGTRVGCGIIRMQKGAANRDPKIGLFVNQNVDQIIFPSEKEPGKNPEYSSADSEFKKIAISNIAPGSSRTVRGTLEMVEEFGGVRIKGQIEGLTPGLHGFHIHQKGSLANKCVDAGGHFNPFDKSHGDPDSFSRHVGDLGNIYADPNGVARINIHDDHISMQETNPAYIGGKSFVVHAKPDDLGKGGNAESLRTGNAGSRVGCGKIRMTKFKDLSQLQAKPQKLLGMAIFIPGNNEHITGRLDLSQEHGGVLVKGLIFGLKPGFHGFHIHQKGDLRNACGAAGGHFNPFQKNHGSPSADDRHAGDLGNIVANHSGIAIINFFDHQISLDPNSAAFVGDRSFVVHALPDDLGTGADIESKKTGNAGSRDGCANIIIHRTEAIVQPVLNPSDFTPPKYLANEEPSKVEKQPDKIVMPDEQSYPLKDSQSTTTNTELQVAIGFQHQTLGTLISQPLQTYSPATKQPLERQPQNPLGQTFESLNTQSALLAEADFIPGKNKGLSGSLRLAASEDNVRVTIAGSIKGLTPGYHGFHVHQTGFLGNECSDAGGHFNPFERVHGAPKATDRHVGDLGNIYANPDGTSIINIIDDHISLDPKSAAFIGGRSFVVHALPDDLGFGNHELSKTTGNAGPRSGCAKIVFYPRRIVLPQ